MSDKDTIYRQAAIDAVKDAVIKDEQQYAEDAFKALPSAQPKCGEWKYHSNPTIGINPEDAYCSCCGFHVDTTGNIDFDEYNFCPRCGVKMES